MTDTTDPTASSPWKAAFSSRGFLLAVGVLAVAAVGLNTAAQALEVYFKKLPVPLRHRLDDEQAGVPKQLGPWTSVQQTSRLNEDVQHTLIAVSPIIGTSRTLEAAMNIAEALGVAVTALAAEIEAGAMNGDGASAES